MSLPRRNSIRLLLTLAVCATVEAALTTGTAQGSCGDYLAHRTHAGTAGDFNTVSAGPQAVVFADVAGFGAFRLDGNPSDRTVRFPCLGRECSRQRDWPVPPTDRSVPSVEEWAWQSVRLSDGKSAADSLLAREPLLATVGHGSRLFRPPRTGRGVLV